MTRKEYYEYLKTLKGEKNPFFGRSHSIDTREKMSLAKLGKPSNRPKVSLPICSCGNTISKKNIKMCRSCYNKSQKRSGNFNWKGGIMKLQSMIRDLPQYKTWRNEVFTRDSFTCQCCGQHGASLHAHHVKEFNILFKEFLQTYNQFSPAEEKEILLRLAMKHEPFWELSNGETQCKKCHKETTWVRI